MQPGQTVYFRIESDVRLKKGELVEQSGECWIVRGCRTATKITRPFISVPVASIVTDHIPSRQRVKKLETGHGNGLCIVAEESLRRQQVVVERLQMSETQLLQCRVMLEIRRRAVRGLASMNRITTSDPDFEELSSEYVVAQLSALRAQAATATAADIREFKRYLAGETDDSRMIMTISRTSRTAAVRYLKRRSQWHQLHTNIDDVAYRLAA